MISPSDVSERTFRRGGIAAINAISILGGFLGPYLMGIARDLTGKYQRGPILMAIPMVCASLIMLHLRNSSVPINPEAGSQVGR